MLNKYKDHPNKNHLESIWKVGDKVLGPIGTPMTIIKIELDDHYYYFKCLCKYDDEERGTSYFDEDELKADETKI